ncbi:MAG: hypothetical protein HY080_11240 [Gammaproteobacteria bacterium]|nr:hypothetical protein [Gammaproteobacteria bacterium]
MTETDNYPVETLFHPDAQTMAELAAKAYQYLQAQELLHPRPVEDVTTAMVYDSLQRFFAILIQMEDPNATTQLSVEEIENLADHGLHLLEELHNRGVTANSDPSRDAYEQLSIPLSVWAARHHLSINELELVVNALSAQANRSHEPQTLSVLCDVMAEIIEAVAADIKQDLDRSNPGRPWRVINLNHGIVATRCGDPQRMESVFEKLLYRLPDDAPGFFDEGMRQMDIIGYPPHVRTVMEAYYRKTHQPTLH